MMRETDELIDGQFIEKAIADQRPIWIYLFATVLVLLGILFLLPISSIFYTVVDGDNMYTNWGLFFGLSFIAATQCFCAIGLCRRWRPAFVIVAGTVQVLTLLHLVLTISMAARIYRDGGYDVMSPVVGPLASAAAFLVAMVSLCAFLYGNKRREYFDVSRRWYWLSGLVVFIGYFILGAVINVSDIMSFLMTSVL